MALRIISRPVLSRVWQTCCSHAVWDKMAARPTRASEKEITPSSTPRSPARGAHQGEPEGEGARREVRSWPSPGEIRFRLVIDEGKLSSLPNMFGHEARSYWSALKNKLRSAWAPWEVCKMSGLRNPWREGERGHRQVAGRPEAGEGAGNEG